MMEFFTYLTNEKSQIGLKKSYAEEKKSVK